MKPYILLALTLVALIYFVMRERDVTANYGTKVNTIEEQRRLNGEL